ncbi:MAG: hypothetical protein IPO85_05345 [Saprospiraceae bacterium]|uniref:Uncharacterized protein n=1 Tax=Candidatus Defluviibacterium haderslevense TaxID=2981993 RepID=A0A9D7S884_9BACT|nr:hypothetical protein [Candidatus Defluviibacterium haderslevense]
MEDKILLIHPEGKKGISMNVKKYNVLQSAILDVLTFHGAITHTELITLISAEIIKNKIDFKGNIGWHVEWVKLDLESKGLIQRTKEKNKLYFSMKNNS